MTTRIILLWVACWHSTLGAEPIADSRLPRFVGAATLDEKTYIILRSPQNDSPPRWLVVGQNYESFDVIAYDKESDVLTLGLGERRFNVPMEKGKTKDGKPIATREESLENARAWLAALERELKARPGYTSYDPTYEQRISPDDKAYLMRSRKAGEAKGTRVFVKEIPWGPHYVSITTLPSQTPNIQSVFANLKAEDWASIDEHYCQLVVGATAVPKAALEKWEKIKREKGK